MTSNKNNSFISRDQLSEKKFNDGDDNNNNNKNKTLFIDLKKKIDYLQIQEYEILKYIPYVHFSCLRKRIVVKWLSKDY